MSAQPFPDTDQQHDPVALIERDHRVVDGLFEMYEALGPDGDPAERWRTVRAFIEELRVHAAIEEQVLYPAVQEALGDEGDQLAEEALREHAEAKETLEELEALDAASGVFHERVTALIEEVRHHVDEEEQELLPKLRDALDSEDLRRLAEELEGAKLTMLGVIEEASPVAGGVVAAPGEPAGAPEAEAEDQAARLAALGDRGGAAASPRSRPPKRGTATTAKRTTAKKPSARKPAATKSTATKSTAKKSSAKKSSAKRSTASRPSTKRSATKPSARTSTTKRTTSGGSARTGSSARIVYHVTPTPTGRWAVGRKGAARPSATFDRKSEAVARGKELAKRPSRGQLVVHAQNGRIQGEFTYGDDPRRSRG